MERIEITTLLALLISPLVLGQNSDVCPNVQTCLTALSQAFTTLCNGNETVPTSSCSCPVEWESLDLIELGTINMGSTSTQTFVIPPAVPSTAREVLVYVFAHKGYLQKVKGQMKIYTESSPTRRFEKYLAIHTYGQSAVSTVSENMFFPMPSNRRIYVRLTCAISGTNVEGSVNVIGYR